MEAAQLAKLEAKLADIDACLGAQPPPPPDPRALALAQEEAALRAALAARSAPPRAGAALR